MTGHATNPPPTLRAKTPRLQEAVIAHSIGAFQICERYHSHRTTYPRHSHDRPSLFVVLSGHIAERARWGEGGGAAETVDCISGAAGFIPAGAEHQSEFGDAAVHSLNILLEDSWLSRSGAMERPPTEPIYATGPWVSAAGMRLRTACAQSDASRTVAVEELVLELLEHSAGLAAPPRATSAPSTTPTSRPPNWLNDALEIIRSGDAASGGAGGVGLGLIAGAVGRSPAHICRAFRSLLGCSVSEFGRAVRIERAAVLLRTTNHSLSRIAFDTGFTDQAHFTRWFRRVMGASPAAYRADCR
jgi:AraC family transcriptional regulator